jgi:hypothetical protein
MRQIKYEGGWQCPSEPSRNAVDPPHEALIGSSTLQTSVPSSGRLLRFISQHLNAKLANCSAWTNGQSPAKGSKRFFNFPVSNAYCTSFVIPKADLPVNKRNKMIPNE